VVASVIVHVLLIALAIRLTAEVVIAKHNPIGDALRLALGGGGGGGGQNGRMYHVEKAPTPTEKPVTEPVPPPPVPTVIPPPPPPERTPVTVAPLKVPLAPTTVAGTGSGGGSGGGRGTGTGTGTGSGQGPGSGSGRGGGNGSGNGPSQPIAQQMIIPPLNAPKALHGDSVEVTFQITAAGEVADIDVRPPIADRKFSKTFDAAMRGYRFHPARDSLGRPVAGTTVVTVIF
jgi:periplasmic protein TonB